MSSPAFFVNDPTKRCKYFRYPLNFIHDDQMIAIFFMERTYILDFLKIKSIL
ncbi:hypothetical protein D3C85_1831420 [compost metagenome]